MNDELINEEIKESKEGLQQLLESTYPLLKCFRDICPGTYKHSLSLATMVEGIALSLNLDPIKLKVAALYHDIGKAFCPIYFSENQTKSVNPHDSLEPEISYNIITRHISDSVAILINDSNFPRDIIEIISQHHGTNVLRYFYNKAKGAKESDFRYKTKRPQSVEAAILMISDQVEARSKSAIQANKFDPNRVIEETINDLLNDSQLDDVTMKLGDLKKIKMALAKELEGTYQKRVDYNVDEDVEIIETKERALVIKEQEE